MIHHTDANLTTARELATMLQVNIETVYKHCRTGHWPSTKIGKLYRFTDAHIEAITATTVYKELPRTSRQNIKRMLKAS